MQTFVWSPRYETGVPLMDTQHRRLVDLINGLGDAVLRGETEGAEDLDRLHAELLDYAQVHFAEEEGLMAEHGLSPVVIARHRGLHVEFVRQIEQMRAGGDLSAERIQAMNRFLASWLVLHILGEDKEIARSIAARIDAAPVPAPAADAAQQSDGEMALLAAVVNLQGALSKANSELRVANADLEDKVAERTLALQNANTELQQLLNRLDEVQSQLLQREKLAAVGQLAAGVAHEINNPVGFVGSNLASLAEYAADLLAIIDAYAATEPLIARDPHALAAIRRIKEERDLDFVRADLKTLLEESRNGLRRVTRIVQDLKDFSHVDETPWQLADLHKGLDSAINVARSEIMQKAELRREYGDLPVVRCHPGQLNQVFMNLLINAAQAIERHGLITVRTGSSGDWGWVEICDDGCGIPAGQLARIFEPFFTTKPVGEGTGLGLSMSHSIVSNHGGRIEVTSEAGKGSCFRVCLPLNPPGADAGADVAL